MKRAQPIDAAAPTADERKALADAQAAASAKKTEFDAAQKVQDDWKRIARNIGIVVARAAAGRRRADAGAGAAAPCAGHGRRLRRRPRRARARHPAAGHRRRPDAARPHARFTDWIDAVNAKAGEYVAYWAVVAVFAYYYEVLARFVFNSPTNWVHESMFLMFGMQYMISGAYAYREDQHVRVDVFYAKFSTRGKAIADIVTSVFFFIFTVHHAVDRLALRRRRRRQRRIVVHRVGHPVLAGEADACRSARR